MSARKAEALGYKNVKVFHAGLPAWKKAGQPVVSNIDSVESMNKVDGSYILVDLRSKDDIEKGHIPKAVAAPGGDVNAFKDQFPKFKGAVTILYNKDGNVDGALNAYKTVTGWGYKQVSILDGGFDAWQKAGKQVATGPAQTKIAYVKKLMPGEIDVPVFQKLAGGESKDKPVLDVRNADEYKECAIAGAIHIPLDQLEGRLAELPKDKEIVIHCATGIRAEMAQNILQKAGLKSKFVKGDLTFDRDPQGKCIAKIEE
ncbi:MAG: rhodanese-like domain-containing protein [Thermodesulfobacteriota bacterium]